MSRTLAEKLNQLSKSVGDIERGVKDIGENLAAYRASLADAKPTLIPVKAGGRKDKACLHHFVSLDINGNVLLGGFVHRRGNVVWFEISTPCEALRRPNDLCFHTHGIQFRSAESAGPVLYRDEVRPVGTKHEYDT